jgi:hypothetical protein
MVVRCPRHKENNPLCKKKNDRKSLSLFQSRDMVFKMIGGSSFSVGTYNSFNISLLVEGILHISIIGTVIFNFPNMVGTSMFN